VWLHRGAHTGESGGAGDCAEGEAVRVDQVAQQTTVCFCPQICLSHLFE
jgi:hypothetical protein